MSRTWPAMRARSSTSRTASSTASRRAAPRRRRTSRSLSIRRGRNEREAGPARRGNCPGHRPVLHLAAANFRVALVDRLAEQGAERAADQGAAEAVVAAVDDVAEQGAAGAA